METLNMILANKSGLGLQEPVPSANKKYLSFLRMRSELIGAVMGVSKFLTTNHLMALREESRDRQKRRDDANDSKLKGLVKDL